MNHDAAIKEITRAVACYLCENPNAADGAPGIARWWLPPGHSYADNQVELALSLLVECGLVTVSQAADRRVRYSMRRGQLGGLVAVCNTGELPVPLQQAGNGGN